jgi:hypothetical protein
VSVGGQIDKYFELCQKEYDQDGTAVGLVANSWGLVWYKYTNRDLPPPPQVATQL